MSVEEDTELRNLVAQTLENKGILPKIRAELRANVFLALEENISARETLLKNEELSAFIQIPVGILILNLVREFLEFFSLDFTLSVFDPETKYGKDYNGLTREKMIKDLNITESKKRGPLLYGIISNVVNTFKDDSGTNFQNEKNVTLNLSHSNLPLGGDAVDTSPLPNMNSTYVKSKFECESTPISTTVLVNGDEKNNDSIEEEIMSKLSLTENSSSEENIKKLDKNSSTVPLCHGDTDELQSFIPVPKDSTEFDLLTFTPVKEVKSKSCIAHGQTEKTDVEENGKSNISVLGNLPPLSEKTEKNKHEMNEIKAIIDHGLSLDNYDDDFHSSGDSSTKSNINVSENSEMYIVHSPDRTQNLDNSNESDKTDVVEENIEDDDDLSDLISSHNFLENQLTLDETVSKLSDIADHLESL